MVCNTSIRASKYSLSIHPEKRFFFYWFLSRQIPDNRIFNPENRIGFGCSRINIRITGLSIRKTGFAYGIHWIAPDSRLCKSGKPDSSERLAGHNRISGSSLTGKPFTGLADFVLLLLPSLLFCTCSSSLSKPWATLFHFQSIPLHFSTIFMPRSIS